MRRLADPVLVVLVGASASGKSHWAAEGFAAEQVVSSDRLRAVVGESEADQAASADAFAVLDAIVAARMSRRLTTVVDTLGLDPRRRAHYRELAARNRVPCVAVAFPTPAAECRRRNASRPRPVPQAVLRGQLAKFAEQRPLLDGEGWAEVVDAEPVRVVPPALAEAAAARSPDPAPALRFGLQLSVWDVPPAELGERLAAVGERAERAGFDSLWVMDHHRQIPQLGRPWEDMPESTATLGFLAAATSRIELGALVNCVTYRNVAHLGKIVATLDVLSGGRAWCGLGAGWFEAEHAAYGWEFPPAAERLDLLEDALQLLPVLWGPGQKPFSGKRIQVPETMCYPRPLRGRVPILVGGQGERRTLRLAAEHADACNLTGDLEAVRHKLGVLRAHCAAAGRDPAEIEVTHLSTALPAADPAELAAEVARRGPAREQARWARRVTPGTVEDHALRARALAAAGVDHVVVALDNLWDGPGIERWGEVVAAARQAGEDDPS